MDLKNNKTLEELEILSNDGYRDKVKDMLERINDNDALRFFCILIHDYSNISYSV